MLRATLTLLRASNRRHYVNRRLRQQQKQSLTNPRSNMKQSLTARASLICMCLILGGCGGLSNQPQPGQPGPPENNSQVPRSAIKNLIVVILQNNSFDHLFGTFPNANGLNSS